MQAIPKINLLHYQQLMQNAKTLKARGEKIYIALTSQQWIVKHIYLRGLWSSSTLYPYALRFKNNADKLAERGFLVPQVQAIFFLKEKNCHLLLYSFMPGQTIRETALQGDFRALAKLPKFIAQLHQQGIYFRDLHTGNILESANQQFSLIDIASVRFKRKALTLRQSANNLAHLFNIQEDQPILKQYGIEKFLQDYYGAISLSDEKQKKLFLYFLQKKI